MPRRALKYSSFRKRKGSSNVYYEQFVRTNYATNLRASFDLAYDDLDKHTTANHAFTRSGLQFSGPTPRGFRNRLCTRFDGSTSQIRLENTSYPFGLSRWTIACWFRKQGDGVATSTSGGADGFPSGDPAVPLVCKGRGEAEGSNVDMNWFLGLNKISNGSTYRLCGDFEQSNTTAGSNNKIVGTTLISNNVWYFGVFTFDGANMRLYLNGIEEAVTPCTNTPRSDSIQKAGIGTGYTSGAVAGGFFQGYMAGVHIWSEALPAADILAIYNKGVASLRREREIVYDAPDNQITHGTNFANWTVTQACTTGSTGVTLAGDSVSLGGRAEITVPGLVANQEYWARVDIAAATASAGSLIVETSNGAQIVDTDSSTIDLGKVLVGTAPKYFKCKALATGDNKLVLRHTGAVATETIRISDFRIFLTPERSTAKVVHLGDATGGFDSTRWNTVADAILHANADALNVVTTGDRADTTNTYPTCNDRLKLGPAGNNGIISRGGKIYPAAGNHDFDGSRETEYDDYFDINSYNGGKFYYPADLGHMRFLVGSNYTDDPDGFAYNSTPQVSQISTQGKKILEWLNDSTQPWNIMMIHYATYSSSSAFGAGHTYGRWQWPGLAVPLILQAHYHGVERLEEQTTVEGATKSTCFYTVARGGGDHHGWTTARTGPTDFTRYRLESSTTSGYLKFYDSANTLVLEYYDTSHNLVDRIKFTLTWS